MEVYVERGQVEVIKGEKTNSIDCPDLEKDNETFLCIFCKKEFKSERGLKVHQRTCKKK